MKKINVTSTYLKNWLESKFKELEIDCPVIECYATRFRSQEYECGAAFYIIRIGEERYSTHVFVFYSRKDLNHFLNNGYELYFRLKHRNFLMDSEINIRKK